MLNKPILESFTGFVADVPAKRLKQNIVKVLLEYLKLNCTEGFPDFMDDLLFDLSQLFDLLDTIDKEIDQSALL